MKTEASASNVTNSGMQASSTNSFYINKQWNSRNNNGEYFTAAGVGGSNTTNSSGRMVPAVAVLGNDYTP